MYITNKEKTKKEKTPGGNSVWWLLSKENGVPNFELRYFEIPVKGYTRYGKHYWEHEVFVVKGLGIVKGKDLKGKKFERKVKPGDAIFIAENEEHQFLNYGNQAFGFICVVPKGVER